MTDLIPPTINIQKVDARTGSAEILQQLRDKLSPQGDVVSPRGRALTEEVFGAPLTPVEVVDRICREVQSGGTSALLHYGKQLDKSDLAANQLRVPAADLASAHQSADAELIESIRRIRDNVKTFQQAILHRDVTIEGLRARLDRDLLEARKERDSVAVAAIGSLKTALANAEAVPVAARPYEVVEGGAEVARRVLSAADITAIVRAEIDERRRSLSEYAAGGAATADLERELVTLERYRWPA